MVSRHDFCVNLPVQFMAQASVTLQLLTGFSTHKIYRKFLIIKFVLWLACKRNLWLPWGKIAGISFFLFFKSSPTFFSLYAISHGSPSLFESRCQEFLKFIS